MQGHKDKRTPVLTCAHPVHSGVSPFAIGADRLDAAAAPLQTIVRCEVTEQIEWDTTGAVVSFTFYLTCAALIVLAVTEAGWRWHFSTAAVLFAGIAASSMCDVLSARGIRYYRLCYATQDGQTHCYTTPSQSEALHLCQVARHLSCTDQPDRMSPQTLRIESGLRR